MNSHGAVAVPSAVELRDEKKMLTHPELDALTRLNLQMKCSHLGTIAAHCLTAKLRPPEQCPQSTRDPLRHLPIFGGDGSDDVVDGLEELRSGANVP
jgi:hypothetical protein